MSRKRRIYVSSTFIDLEAHRVALRTALEKAQYDVESMEKYPAFDERPLDKCLADAATADIYVLLLAHRYGFRPKEGNPERKSITHLEYEEAGRHQGKRRFVFTVDPDHPWNPKWIDKGKDARDLKIFRTAVENRHGVNRFTNPNQLASLVLQALHAWETGAGRTRGETPTAHANGWSAAGRDDAGMQATVRRADVALTTFIAAWQRRAEATFQRAFIDFSAFITDKTMGFVGRRFVFDAVDRFLAQAASGYFVLRGDPGIGKSAVMAQLAKGREYPHHFNIASEGIGSSKQFFLNACAQLIARHGLDHASLPDDAGGDNNYFKRILAEASKKSLASFCWLTRSTRPPRLWRAVVRTRCSYRRRFPRMSSSWRPRDGRAVN